MKVQEDEKEKGQVKKDTFVEEIIINKKIQPFDTVDAKTGFGVENFYEGLFQVVSGKKGGGEH